MRLGKILLIVLITILLSFSLTFLFYNWYIIQDIQELGMKMKIGSIVGFDTNSSAISFGIVPIGGSSERPVILKNIHNKPLNVHIKKDGEMAKWVYFSENDFILEGNETKEIKVEAIPSYNAQDGAYEGKVKFIFKRVI